MAPAAASQAATRALRTGRQTRAVPPGRRAPVRVKATSCCRSGPVVVAAARRREGIHLHHFVGSRRARVHAGLGEHVFTAAAAAVWWGIHSQVGAGKGGEGAAKAKGEGHRARVGREAVGAAAGRRVEAHVQR